MEGVSQEDLARDAAAIEQLMETVLMKEKQETEKAKVGRGVPTACCIRYHIPWVDFSKLDFVHGEENDKIK